ncbi:MAG TPA: C39 family peptidase [Candidatus Paceibacterota bacterium]|nr:C39 family peptidase [Verrucomicrobiota bacterium]HRZ45532.1 C39 family peptidase [Candidatus Paceibacterota bacterium]HRZ93139.1 C39 family peptidase [Candidatus Paceibacterota bacterium]
MTGEIHSPAHLADPRAALVRMRSKSAGWHPALRGDRPGLLDWLGAVRSARAGRVAAIAWIGLCHVACVIQMCADPLAGVPRDWRGKVQPGDFQQVSPGQWASPWVRPDFAFDELIYSWRTDRPGDAFRLHLQVRFGPSDETGWLYAGSWGAVTNLAASRRPPAFDRGVLDMDWLRLKARAAEFRFQVTGAGAAALANPPALTVIATDNHAAPSQGRAEPARVAARVLDVPLRRQLDARGQWMKDRCQSAALASAMEYYGQSVLLEEIVRLTHDPEYDYPGIWPRVIGAAREFGFEGSIERFRDWAAVRRALAENQMILCSIRMKEGDCQAPPYASMGNHIVVLCGVTDDGRAVVTDSALGKSGAGYLCQWLQSDFETVWMRTKGGIAMVLCPPPGAAERRIQSLPPFPADRALPAGDDH